MASIAPPRAIAIAKLYIYIVCICGPESSRYIRAAGRARSPPPRHLKPCATMTRALRLELDNVPERIVEVPVPEGEKRDIDFFRNIDD